MRYGGRLGKLGESPAYQLWLACDKFRQRDTEITVKWAQPSCQEGGHVLSERLTNQKVPLVLFSYPHIFLALAKAKPVHPRAPTVTGPYVPLQGIK